MNEQLKQEIKKEQKLHKYDSGKWYKEPIHTNILNATTFLPNDATMQERVYCILNDIDYIVKCQNEKCSNPAGFNMKTYKYKKYCCSTCSNRSKQKQEKTKKTCLEKYGVENPMQNEEIKKISSENNPTHKEGYENIKYKQTMLEKYGVDHPMHSKEIKERLKETNLEKYGVENVMQDNNTKEKNRRKLLDNSLNNFKLDLANNNLTLLTPDEDFEGKNNKFYTYKCNTCNHIFVDYINSYKTLPLCPKCNNIKETGVSGIEKEIREFIKDNYDGELLHNKKNLLENRLEIDIFLSELNIGFEINGLYFHSLEKGKDIDYHITKRNLAFKKGIELIQIFEDEWNSNKESIKNLILSKITKIEDEYFVIYFDNEIEIFNDDMEKVADCKINNNYISDFMFYQPVNFLNIFKALKNEIDSFYIEDDLRFNCFTFLENMSYDEFSIPPYLWVADLHKRDLRFTSFSNPFESDNFISIYDCGYKVYKIN